MLLSVIIMALPSREPGEASCDTEAPKVEGEKVDISEEGAASEVQEAAEADDETLSLGSFVASEVSFRSEVLRRRSRFTKPKVVARCIGASFPVVALCA